MTSEETKVTILCIWFYLEPSCHSVTADEYLRPTLYR